MPERFEIKAGDWHCYPAPREDKLAKVQINTVICKPKNRTYPYFQFIGGSVFIHNLKKGTHIQDPRMVKGIANQDVEVQVVSLKGENK